MLKKLTMLTAAASLAMGGVAASQAQAAGAPLPRAGAEMDGTMELRGRSETFVQLSVLAVIALLIWAGTELFDDDDDADSP